MRILRATPVLILFFAAALFPDLTTAGEQRIKTYSLQWAGQKRSFILYEPRKGTAGAPLPLLLALHGGGGTARGVITLTKGRFNELADREGFLVAYPDGIDKHWNDQRSQDIDRAHNEKIDDAGFLLEIVNLLAREKNADPRRVFITGISNGGFMSLRMACEHSGRIRGAAIVTAQNPVEAREACKPANPLPILFLNGTEDPLVPYNGGDVKVLMQVRGRVVSTDETIQFWTAANRCTGEPVVEKLPDTDPADGTRVIRNTWKPAGGGAPVILYRIEGGGHTWPGGWKYLPAVVIGRVCMDINACDIIWEFFGKIK